MIEYKIEYNYILPNNNRKVQNMILIWSFLCWEKRKLLSEEEEEENQSLFSRHIPTPSTQLMRS